MVIGKSPDRGHFVIPPVVAGAVVTQIRAKPGDNLSLAEIEQEIAKHRPTLFFTVQGDSSTGVYQPVEGVGDICHK